MSGQPRILMTLTTVQLRYMVLTLSSRMDTIEQTECNAPLVRAELAAELASLRGILAEVERSVVAALEVLP